MIGNGEESNTIIEQRNDVRLHGGKNNAELIKSSAPLSDISIECCGPVLFHFVLRTDIMQRYISSDWYKPSPK